MIHLGGLEANWSRLMKEKHGHFKLHKLKLGECKKHDNEIRYIDIYTRSVI